MHEKCIQSTTLPRNSWITISKLRLQSAKLELCGYVVLYARIKFKKLDSLAIFTNVNTQYWRYDFISIQLYHVNYPQIIIFLNYFESFWNILENGYWTWTLEWNKMKEISWFGCSNCEIGHHSLQNILFISIPFISELVPHSHISSQLGHRSHRVHKQKHSRQSYNAHHSLGVDLRPEFSHDTHYLEWNLWWEILISFFTHPMCSHQHASWDAQNVRHRHRCLQTRLCDKTHWSTWRWWFRSWGRNGRKPFRSCHI